MSEHAARAFRLQGSDLRMYGLGPRVQGLGLRSSAANSDSTSGG